MVATPDPARRVARAVLVVISLVLLAAACASTRHATNAPHAEANDGGDDATASLSDDAGDDADAMMAIGNDDGGASPEEVDGPCPSDMVLVETTAPPRRFCIDMYEASLVEVMPDNAEQPFPHYMPVDGHVVRAVSRAGVFPQGYISEVQAQDACSASGKRLCGLEEWKTACKGPTQTTFPYGNARRTGFCNDNGKSAVVAVFGAKAVAASTPYTAAPTRRSPIPSKATKPKRPPKTARSASASRAAPKAVPPPRRPAHVTRGRAAQATRPRVSRPLPYVGRRAPARPALRVPARKSERPSSVDPGVWAKLNDPRLGQVEGGLATTGDHSECVNGFGAFDMVGNIHEWVATDSTLPLGTFAGGYYLDTSINGDGCNYKTQAHAHEYHDYSTGFRCCTDAADSAR